MDIDELQNFIQNQTYSDVSDEKYNELMEDSESMDFGSFVEKHDDFLKKNSKGWSGLRDKGKPLAERITGAFGKSESKNPFDQDKNYVDEIYEDNFKDVPREQFDETLNNMKSFWDAEVKARDYEAGLKRREQETKHWGIRDILASEYEKQRYIHEPEKALFGEEAPSIGSAPETRFGAAKDLGLGAAGAVADVVPTPIHSEYWLGPVIRGARDVSHIATGSPYAKDPSQILGERGVDFGINVAAGKLRNFGKQQKVSKGFIKDPAIKDVIALESETKNILDGAELLKQKINTASIDDLSSTIKNLPESDMKKVLMEYTKDATQLGKPETRQAIMTKVAEYEKYANPEMQKAIKSKGTEELIKETEGEYIANRPYIRQILEAPELTKKQQVSKKVAETVLKHADSNVGAGLVKTLATAGVKIPGASVKRPGATSGVESQKDWYKKNYTRFWLAGFKPKEEPGDPLWEAYKEWEEGK